MIYSMAMTAQLHQELAHHLLHMDRQEDLCFAIWFPSRGRNRMTALVQELILPAPGDRIVHGNVSFDPIYLERAADMARRAGGGLALLHSHLGPGWQGMSSDDIRAERNNAGIAMASTGLPMVGLTLGTDGAWSGRFWVKTGPNTYAREWCGTVRVVGERLTVTYNDMLQPVPVFREELTRTISAWGEKAQAHLARLHVGVVGAGSVGCIVAESLARMGIQHISLFDFDDVEQINLDRLLHATRADIGRAKVNVLADALTMSATADGFCVEPFEHSILEEDGFRLALDCDVLFSCVDRPWARSVLNLIAYAHLVPVVDGGVAVRVKSGGKGIAGADWRAHIASPERRCLECLGQYDPSLVQAEREGSFDDPSYIAGLPDDHQFKRNENVFAFGLSAASLEINQFLSMSIAPLGVANTGAQIFHFAGGSLDSVWSVCEQNCLYPEMLAKGDSSGYTVTGDHLRAEEARVRRHELQAATTSQLTETNQIQGRDAHGWINWLQRIFRRIIHHLWR